MLCNHTQKHIQQGGYFNVRYSLQPDAKAVCHAEKATNAWHHQGT